MYVTCTVRFFLYTLDVFILTKEFLVPNCCSWKSRTEQEATIPDILAISVTPVPLSQTLPLSSHISMCFSSVKVFPGHFYFSMHLQLPFFVLGIRLNVLLTSDPHLCFWTHKKKWPLSVSNAVPTVKMSTTHLRLMQLWVKRVLRAQIDKTDGRLFWNFLCPLHLS